MAGAIAGMGVLVFESLEGRIVRREPSDIPGDAVKVPFALHLCHGAAWGAAHAIGRDTGAPTTAMLFLHTTALAATDSAVFRLVGFRSTTAGLDGREIAAVLGRAAVHASLTAAVLTSFTSRGR